MGTTHGGVVRFVVHGVPGQAPRIVFDLSAYATAAVMRRVSLVQERASNPRDFVPLVLDPMNPIPDPLLFPTTAPTGHTRGGA
ncbi:hypothetical protein [Embleya sp. MST-111070]|uniref:hypothetical protein n=1 Tax=Embleya sp. MST-111070 TaxID=3398231 RepID=UPI003F73DE55